MDSVSLYRPYESYSFEEKAAIYHLFLAKKSVVSTQRAYRKVYGLQKGAPSNKQILQVIHEFTVGLNPQLARPADGLVKNGYGIQSQNMNHGNQIPVSSASSNYIIHEVQSDFSSGTMESLEASDLLVPIVQIKEDPEAQEVCLINQDDFQAYASINNYGQIVETSETESFFKKRKLQDPLDIAETSESPAFLRLESVGDESSETILITPSTSMFPTAEDENVEETLAWACDSCEKMFPDMNSLQEHIQSGCDAEVLESETSSSFSIRVSAGFHNNSTTTNDPLNIESNKVENDVQKLEKPRRKSIKSKVPDLIALSQIKVEGDLEPGEVKNNLPKESLSLYAPNGKDRMVAIKCGLCSKFFDSRLSLHGHYSRIHPRERPHSCKICGKNYQASRYLREHMLTHSEKTLKCPVCGRMYHLQRRLKGHLIRTHRLPESEISSKLGPTGPSLEKSKQEAMLNQSDSIDQLL